MCIWRVALVSQYMSKNNGREFDIETLAVRQTGVAISFSYQMIHVIIFLIDKVMF
jgi:hypothetical protein